MQKLVFILSCVVLLGWACGGKNKAEVASEIAAETAELDKSSEVVKNAKQGILTKVESQGGTDSLVKGSKLWRYSKAIHRFDEIVKDGEKIKQDMEQLALDYAAGKLKESEYNQQFKILQEKAKKQEEFAKDVLEKVNDAVQ